MKVNVRWGRCLKGLWINTQSIAVHFHLLQVESFILDQEDIEDTDSVLDTSKFLLASENLDGSDLRSVDPETQAKLEALLEAAGKFRYQ